MPLDADIYGYKEAVAPSLVASTALHAGLLACILFLPAVFNHTGEDWGNNGSGGPSGGDAISAHLVSGVPLPPHPNAKPENVLANDSAGLSQSIPAPAAKPDQDAIAIPDKLAPKPAPVKLPPANQKSEATIPSRLAPKTPATPAHEQPREVAKADNTVPFGSGGPVSGPYTAFQNGNTAGGLKFGEGGSGGFGSRFGWYTDVVARKVHQAWQSEVNPSVQSAKRVYVLFDIARSGEPSNVRIEQSSGIPSLDQSAVRALQRIDTFGPLPQGYAGKYVSVEFWFDYRR
jgi:protein TonB